MTNVVISCFKTCVDVCAVTWARKLGIGVVFKHANRNLPLIAWIKMPTQKHHAQKLSALPALSADVTAQLNE